MRSDSNKYGIPVAHSEDGSVVTGDVYATAGRKLFVHGMVVEQWMERLAHKKIFALHKFDTNVARQRLEPLKKCPVKNDSHVYSDRR
jgi:hypothetical protein